MDLNPNHTEITVNPITFVIRQEKNIQCYRRLLMTYLQLIGVEMKCHTNFQRLTDLMDSLDAGGVHFDTRQNLSKWGTSATHVDRVVQARWSVNIQE